MSNDDTKVLSQIAARLSLRKPQRDSLEILSDLCSRLTLSKSADVVEALASVQAEYPSVTDFERAFPSVCFALATGVGKTRLMGAFVAFMALTNRSKNFFVLAPNTTIYEKLIADFEKRNSPKYVFPGIAEFARTPPTIVTGDTWERSAVFIEAAQRNGDPIINIFNVDKINKDKGRIKRLHEYIGESYFEWLSGLPDLVLLLDEAHRYRAKAGMKAVAELRPILGLELTATPRTVGASSRDFKNVIYRYGLAEALRDKYIKEPAVATRANFRKDRHTDDEIEKIKLEDGVRYHEHIKIELDIYARASGRPKVHPFMLVVAEDTEHASALRTRIESDDFFAGRYKGKVAEVHSNTGAEETEDAVERLVALEHDARTEIVIHVNKLKEGWDVTNLYTIVPLRRFAADILTEQTLGRGLRLPYGVRTGNEAVDRLTIIAHDKFDEIIARAREPGSIVMAQVRIGEGGDVGGEEAELVEVASITSGALMPVGGVAEEGATYILDTADKQAIGRIALEAFRSVERKLAKPEDLRKPEIIAEIAAKVAEMAAPIQGALDGIVEELDIRAIVALVAENLALSSIAIPEIVLLPKREVNFGYRDFDLADISTINVQPVADEILIQAIRDGEQMRLAIGRDGPKEARLEDYIVRHLMVRDEVDYDEQAALLYKLAGQVVTRMRGYLSDEAQLENALQYHARMLSDFIFQQMADPAHYWETPTDYEVRVLRSFRRLEPQAFNLADRASRRGVEEPANPLSATRRFIFGGFKKCCYPWQRFQSDDERQFALLIDRHEPKIMRWLKPGAGQFQIEYKAGAPYEPDFVIEAEDRFSIVEIKAANELDDPDVKAKARAATRWCELATTQAQSSNGKPWSYALVPDTSVHSGATFFGILAAHVTASPG